MKVCIIGAGSSGIVAAKTLLQRGIPFDCFEKGSGIGGLWRYENDNGLSVAYQSLHINSSRRRTQFSDFKMPVDYPDFPHHTQIAQYFDAYVDHFGLRPHITFRTMVKHVQPLPGGGYRVHTEDQEGRPHTGDYTAVIVANGHHSHARWPEMNGQFSGQTLHTSQYRTPHGMAGKRVLVIGFGNSACDIACELSRVAAKVFIAVRRGGHIIPKYLFGRPTDRLAPAWMWRYLPFKLFQRMFGIALRLARGRMSQFQLPEPTHRILEEHPTISCDLLNLIGHGKVHIKPNVRELAGSQVRFEDGSEEAIDVILYATGYDIKTPFLDREVFDTTDNDVYLYKMVVHPEQPGLYFIGLVQPWGAIMPLAEEQSRWVADLLEGKCRLPPPADMLRITDRDQQSRRRRYTSSPRHTIQVDFWPYLDEIREERRRGEQRARAAARPIEEITLPRQAA